MTFDLIFLIPLDPSPYDLVGIALEISFLSLSVLKIFRILFNMGTAYSEPFLGGFRGKTPPNLKKIIILDPKRHFLTSIRVF